MLGAVGRAITKIFRYAVEPDAQAAMIFVNAIVHSGIVVDGNVTKRDLCTYMLSDTHAVHYVKLCTGEGAHADCARACVDSKVTHACTRLPLP